MSSAAKVGRTRRWKPQGHDLDFFRRWAEGMGGDEEREMLRLVRVAEIGGRIVAQPFTHVRSEDMIELREALDGLV